MNHYFFDYSRTYNPAAPVVQVTLRTRHGASDRLSAFLDTGADGTIVPLTILRQIGARYNDKRNLFGATGAGQLVGLYPIHVQIGTQLVYGINAAGYGNEVIIGRDVLNQITVILEGPIGICEIRI